MPRTIDRSKYLSDSEVAKLRRSCRDWDIADRQMGRETGLRVWLVVDIALSTGLRVSELAALMVEHLDFAAGAIRVRRLKKKKPFDDYIPLPPKLAEHIRGYLAGRTTGPVLQGQRGPLTSRGWQHAWLSACRKAGIRTMSIHKARHTSATILYRKTRDLRLVQKQLGHSSPAMTAVYADVSFEAMQQAAETMYPDD